MHVTSTVTVAAHDMTALLTTSLKLVIAAGKTILNNGRSRTKTQLGSTLRLRSQLLRPIPKDGSTGHGRRRVQQSGTHPS